MIARYYLQEVQVRPMDADCYHMLGGTSASPECKTASLACGPKDLMVHDSALVGKSVLADPRKRYGVAPTLDTH